eukprot:SAG31_NODE_289_length_18388_cov_7.110504_8_plen_180_part_00
MAFHLKPGQDAYTFLGLDSPQLPEHRTEPHYLKKQAAQDLRDAFEQAQLQATSNFQEALRHVDGTNKHVAQDLRVAFERVTRNKNKTIKKISIESNTMTRKGLATRLVGRPQWRDGPTKFQRKSADIIWDSDYRVGSERLINRLLTISIAVTPITFSHACMQHAAAMHVVQGSLVHRNV